MVVREEPRSFLSAFTIFAVLLFLFILAIAILAGSVAYVPEATTAVCSVLKMKMLKDTDHCIQAIAVFVHNAELCDAIAGPSATIGGQSVQLENPPKMECYTKIAEQTKNPALCDRVEGMIVANTRIDCLFRVARSAKDKNICGLIGSGSQSRMGREMNAESCRTSF